MVFGALETFFPLSKSLTVICAPNLTGLLSVTFPYEEPSDKVVRAIQVKANGFVHAHLPWSIFGPLAIQDQVPEMSFSKRVLLKLWALSFKSAPRRICKMNGTPMVLSMARRLHARPRRNYRW